MSKIAVLGANGFIGRYLVQGLAKNQNDTILAFDHFSSLQAGKDHPFDRYSNVILVQGDFFNRSELADVTRGADYVFHLISTTTPATSSDDPLIDIETNLKGSIELFQRCSENGVGKIIFLSSGGTVYGDLNSGKINESCLPLPRSPYGISKLTIEHYLRYFRVRAGLDYIIYRVANPYGPGQNIYGKQGVIPVFMHRYLTKEPITIYGDGTMVRDYIYIDDLIEMIINSYARPNKYAEYNLGSGKGKNILDIIKCIESCTGFETEKIFKPSPPTYVHKSVLDITRYREEFGLQPKISLSEGIRKTWEYVNEIEK